MAARTEFASTLRGSPGSRPGEPQGDGGEEARSRARADAFLDFSSFPASFRANPTRSIMAKAVTIKVKLVSSADTGFFYVTKKNSRTMTEKLTKKKYDPVAKKHVEFRESRIK
jgi:large subunit ribosomal protein L33